MLSITKRAEKRERVLEEAEDNNDVDETHPVRSKSGKRSDKRSKQAPLCSVQEGELPDDSSDEVIFTEDILLNAEENPSKIIPIESSNGKSYFFFRESIFPTYLEARNAKAKANEERLAALGFGKRGILESMIPEGQVPKQKRRPKKSSDSKHANNVVSLRRSRRATRKPAEYSGSELDSIEDLKSTVIKYQTKPKESKRVKARPFQPLTDEQRVRLEKAEGEWLVDFEDFLKTVPHGNGSKVCSGPNTRMVLRQTRKLISGAGVEYAHWPDDQVFCKGETIKLSDDFDELLRRAQHFENEHGRDKGNGWLLRHPIVKIRCYQAYRLGKDCL